MIRNLLLFWAALILFLGLIELGLRATGVAYPVFVRPDEQLGWGFVPGVHGYSAHEGFAHVSINRAGFRDRDWTVEKPAGIYRVAVLGDSFVDATNVAVEDGFVRQIARALAADCGGVNFEVMNFGVSGYGTGQEFLQLRDRVLAYRPDLVVLGFYNGNDVADTTNTPTKGWQDNKPLFTERNGALETEAFPTEGWRAWARQLRPIVALIDHFYLAGVVKQAVSGKPLWGGNRPATREEEAAALAAGTPPRPQHPEMFCPPKDAAWEKSWSQVEFLLDAMRDAAEARNARFLVVGIPEPTQIYPTAAGRQKILQASALCSLSYPEERLGDFTLRAGIDYLPLAPAMQADADKDHIFYYGFPGVLGQGHWNERGNKRGGELAAARICAVARQ